MITKTRRLVKLVVVPILIYLPIQYGVVGMVDVIASEPWPAFVLPGFKNIYSTQDRVEIVEPHFYARWGGEHPPKQIVPAQVLFDGLQPSQLQGFIRTHFQDSTKVAAFSPQTRMWLRQKVQKVFPDRAPPVALEVVWARVTYDQTGTGVRVDHETVEKKITIQLSNP